jgi:hypothetical protein
MLMGSHIETIKPLIIFVSVFHHFLNFYCWLCSQWWGNLRERDHWEDPGVDGRIILRLIFRKWDMGVWTGSRWLRLGTEGGLL